jgi:hypothetical protein
MIARFLTKAMLLLLPLPLLASSIQAFTLSSEPFTNPVSGVTPCYVDEMQQFMNEQDYKDLSTVMTCSYQAALMGVQKLPAVVVDQKYVVYGNTDMTGAVQEIANAQSHS